MSTAPLAHTPSLFTEPAPERATREGMTEGTREATGWRHPRIPASETLAALQLIRTPRVGPVTFFHLLRFYGSPARALERLPELTRRGGGKPYDPYPLAHARAELAKLAALGAQVLPYGAPGYPAQLADVDDAPPLLFARGNPELAARPCIALVGARNASANGMHFARTLAAALVQAGITVVSGLARGIDAAAHHGALHHGALTGTATSGTVGVIASGLDVIYPPEHATLQEDVATRGLLLTEQPCGAAPQARSFPARNRVIAGMTLGTVVVEAAPKSGSLITVGMAAGYGREIFAVPGSPLDPRARGPNGLLKEGATMVESVDDITRELAPALAQWQQRAASLLEPAPAGFRAAPPTEPDTATLNAARAALLERLSPVPTALEDLLTATGVPTPTALLALLELELAGRLQRHTGGRVSLVVA